MSSIKWNRLQTEPRKSLSSYLISILYPNNANNEKVSVVMCGYKQYNFPITFLNRDVLSFDYSFFFFFAIKRSRLRNANVIRINRRYRWIRDHCFVSFSFISNHFLLWNATTMSLRAHPLLSVARCGNSEERTNRSKWYSFFVRFYLDESNGSFHSIVFVSRIEGTWEINRSTGKYISFFFLPLWQCDENINILRI